MSLAPLKSFYSSSSPPPPSSSSSQALGENKLKHKKWRKSIRKTKGWFLDSRDVLCSHFMPHLFYLRKEQNFRQHSFIQVKQGPMIKQRPQSFSLFQIFSDSSNITESQWPKYHSTYGKRIICHAWKFSISSLCLWENFHSMNDCRHACMECRVWPIEIKKSSASLWLHRNVQFCIIKL